MIEVSRSRAGFTVQFPYDQQLVVQMRQVPGAEWDRQQRTWKLPLDIFSVDVLHQMFGEEILYGEGVEGWIGEEIHRRRKLREALAGSGKLLYERAGVLYEYQRKAVGFLAEAGRGLLSDQMGLGKTVEMIATIREIELRELRTLGMYLIVCPNSMRHTWEAEIRRWYPDEEVPVYHVGGRGCPHPAEGEPGFYIVNWEKTWRRAELAQVEWDVVVGDESHRMKGRNTKQSKAVRKLLGDRRYLLTGTPIKNEVTDLWAQLNFIQPERWTSYWKFFDRYVEYREGFFGKEVVGVRNPEELKLRLEDTMIGRTIDDVEIELPPLVHKRITVSLEGAQRKAYDQMRDEFVAMINDSPEEFITAKNWLSQVLRLKQIAGSLGIFSEVSQSAKIDALMELIDELPDGEKFVVMSQFRGMVDEVTERLRAEGIPYCELTGQSCETWNPTVGSRSAPDRQQLIDYFQTSDNPKVFIATTQTGGEGITLTAARYFVFLDLLWTPGDNEQALKRIHRVGQGRACFVYEILARDTVDFSAVLPKLRSKQDVIDAVMRPKDPPPDDTYTKGL